MNNKNIPNKDWWNNNPMTYEDWDLSKDIRASLNADKFKKINFDYIFHNPYLKKFFNNLENFNEKETALDIGCGWGTSSVILSKIFKKVISIDISEKSIEATSENIKLNGKIKNIFLKRLDAEMLNYENYFNLVYSWGVIHHSHDTETILKNIFKSLKINGTCLIMIYNKNSIRYYLKGLYYLFFKLKIFKGYNLDTVQKLFTDGYYQRHFTQDELNRILLQIGFNNINFEIGHMQKSYLPFFPKNSFIDNFLKKNFGWFLIAEFKK